MSSTVIDWSPVVNADTLRSRIERIAPLLAFEDAFDLSDTHLDHPELLTTLVEQGALRVVGVTYDSGSPAKQYAWCDPAREALEAYRASVPTLPCGCRAHVPPGGGDTPPDHLACKHCGAVHAKAVYREAL